ncbi:nitrate- and nitrite sensing domain-containing protein [Streptomyces sp. NPDC058045]|uniref:sensor histidine kinase n=1 Tax=Streptomyces sp. NPDC058045 TaxID=3346311 RepID=UPI0036E58A95
MQGRFKRDGSASAEPEPRGETDPTSVGSSPQHAPTQTQRPSGKGGAPLGGSGGGGGKDGDSASPPADVKPAPGPKSGSAGTGSRLALRNWRISTRLVSLLALPVVAATSLGAVRINQNMDDIQQLDNMKLLTELTKQATQLATALQEERDRSAGPLAHGTGTSAYDVTRTRAVTDKHKDEFSDETRKIDEAGKKSKTKDLLGVRTSITQVSGQLNDLQEIRSRAYQDPSSSLQTIDAYSQLIEQLLNLSQDMAQATSNPEMVQRTRALAAFSTAKEYASVQRAVIAAALPPNSKDPGKLSETDRHYGFAAHTKEASRLQAFSAIYDGDAQGNGGDTSDELLMPINNGNPTIKEADTYADRVLRQRDGLKIQEKRSYKDWVDADSTKIQAMIKIEGSLLSDMEQKARNLRNESKQSAIISGVLILLVLGVSIVGAFLVGRSMIRSLRRLQDTATRVAQDRLPELVKQLSDSDPQDVDTSVASVGAHSRDEIGKVAAAFDDVHREAVRLAAEQALLRGNVNAMFTNLSRRSQGLIQRQLSLISELESREADPDQLSSLFKLDHLATRMRRNGENLLVLAGEEPGRRWTRPVPLVDVLRAAASEVEQYERIELASVPATEVAGRVVNDLVHLLAELLENATSFSSPQTKVKVTGHALPDGRVLIEIHDTGIGLSPEDLASINERLASPPTVDVSVSRRMGLFVVGRLSQRHGIRIQLRPSDSGGTTALVMLPVEVAQGGRKVPGKPGGGPAAAQAAAGAAEARRNAGAGGGGASLLESSRSTRLVTPQRGRRGEVGAGSGPRAALPARDSGRSEREGGLPTREPQTGGLPTREPQGNLPGRERATPSTGVNLFGGPATPQGGPGTPRQDRYPMAGAFGHQAAAAQDQGSAQDLGPVQDLGPAGIGGPGSRGPVPPQQRTGDAQEPGRRPELPARGGPRAELPGGNSQPRVPSWSEAGERPALPGAQDGPRGHEEHQAQDTRQDAYAGYDERQGPGSTAQLPRITEDREPPRGDTDTAQFPRIDARQGPPAGLPQRGGSQGDGTFVRSDVFGGRGESTGSYPRPQEPQQARADLDAGRQGYDRGAHGNSGHDGGGYDTGGYDRYPDQDPSGTGQFAQLGQDPSGTGQFAQLGQGPSDTGQFALSGQDLSRTGEYQRPGQDPSSTGQFTRPGQDPSSTGQFTRPGQDPSSTGQFTRPGQDPSGTGEFERPGFPGDRWPAVQRRPEPEALPPAQSPGDGRTPLYDNLMETSWFRGGQGDPAAGRQADPGPQQAQPETPDATVRPATIPGGPGVLGTPQAPAGTTGTGRANGAHSTNGSAGPGAAGDQGGASPTWRSSPNDELGRQAERVRQPSAGGVTTSGLPRRVPRANLVAGTAQQQQHQTGPQVSRAPDDVRGRLTNLRRGIQQGRQAGNGPSTGSFPSPTHQQER